MTDSQSESNGPSLKLAALSVESYHLDSPPFTGTAVGGSSTSPSWDGDQLDQAGGELAARSAPSPNGHPTISPRISNGITSSLMEVSKSSSSEKSQEDARRATTQASGSQLQPGQRWETSISDLHRHQRQRTPEQTSSSATSDRDVPSWQLDGKPSTTTPATAITIGRSNDRQGAHTATSGTAPLSSSSNAASTAAHAQRRPLLTQLTDDLDGLDHQHDPDRDVDCDGQGFVLSQQPRDPSGFSEQGASQGIVPVQSRQMADYTFPHHRLPLKMRDESKIPLVIVACGSFSPPTYLHLRIFEMAKDQVIESGKYELLAGYYSPVSDHYRKAGLAQAVHRVRMCELAVEKTSTWLMVDAWESLQNEYQRTAVVLDHFNEEINGPAVPSTAESEAPQPERGVLLSNGRRRRVKIMLLAGGDLIQSMGEPGVWADADLHHILGRYGCMIVERTGADVWSFLLSHDLLWRYRRNLRVVKQTIYNDISSSKVRLFVRRGQSIKYLLPSSVIKYIETHKLYRLPADEEKPQPAPEEEDW